MSFSKPTAKPQSTNDCSILLERTDAECTRIDGKISTNNKQIDELTAKILELQKQVERIKSTNTSLKAQHTQHQTNLAYLTRLHRIFSEQDKQRTYFNRCKEYISKYKWVKPDEVCDDGDDNTNALPQDVFSYLDIEFAPLDSYTSSEITQIAHYLKACELLAAASLVDKNVPANFTYGEMIKLAEHRYGDKIGLLDPYNEHNQHVIGGLDREKVDSDSESEDDWSDKSVKCYGDILVHLENVKLDTDKIIMYSERIDTS